MRLQVAKTGKIENTWSRASLSGDPLLTDVRLLDPIFKFEFTGRWSIQLAMFQFTDSIVTAGLVASGPKAIHELMAPVNNPWTSCGRVKDAQGTLESGTFRREHGRTGTLWRHSGSRDLNTCEKASWLP